MAAILKAKVRDIGKAARTWPDSITWRRCFFVYATFFAAAVPLGWISGLLRFERISLSAETLTLPVLILVRPAILEEVLFRVLLLPRDRERWSRNTLVLQCVVALAIFLAAHPLHAWLMRPEYFGLFSSPGFLFSAGLLGVACTVTYLISRSLWPPVFLHWISVTVWILFFHGPR